MVSWLEIFFKCHHNSFCDREPPTIWSGIIALSRTHRTVGPPSPPWLLSPAGWTPSGAPLRASHISDPQCNEPLPLTSAVQTSKFITVMPSMLNTLTSRKSKNKWLPDMFLRCQLTFFSSVSQHQQNKGSPGMRPKSQIRDNVHKIIKNRTLGSGSQPKNKLRGKTELLQTNSCCTFFRYRWKSVQRCL